MMPKKKSRVFIALGTSLLKWHAILGRGVFFVNTPRWTRVNNLDFSHFFELCFTWQNKYVLALDRKQ